MAGQIKLTPDELRTSAQKYSQGSQNVQDVLTSLTNEQTVISENWNGNAFDAFEQQFNELSPKVSQFAELLQAINGQLNSVAGNLEEVDSSMASQISGS